MGPKRADTRFQLPARAKAQKLAMFEPDEGSDDGEQPPRPAPDADRRRRLFLPPSVEPEPAADDAAADADTPLDGGETAASARDEIAADVDAADAEERPGLGFRAGLGATGSPGSPASPGADARPGLGAPTEQHAGLGSATAAAAADYMEMAIVEPETAVHPAEETYSQKRNRILREQAERGITRPPAEVSREKREAALSTSLFESAPSSAAMRMMAKMGYTPGQALGRARDNDDDDRLREPLRQEARSGRVGIGHEAIEREQLAAAAAAAAAAVEDEETQRRDFVARLAENNTEKQVAGKLRAAQGVCQTLDAAADPEVEAAVTALLDYSFDSDKAAPAVALLDKLNVLWRDTVVETLELRREKALRSRQFDRAESSDDDPLEDEPTDTLATFNATTYYANDDEMSEALEREPAERLADLLEYQRAKYSYCFWCGCAYDGPEDLAENCPGLNEADHD
ncbi:uncharacterized protein V1510DRAFT_417934 [Dipodascopsis tothii]|uniref:uncharacterized protein n=1 Tax=Dipodascopsis tothii TaxID=44089 RepID=UPI0034CFD272